MWIRLPSCHPCCFLEEEHHSRQPKGRASEARLDNSNVSLPVPDQIYRIILIVRKFESFYLMIMRYYHCSQSTLLQPKVDLWPRTKHLPGTGAARVRIRIARRINRWMHNYTNKRQERCFVAKWTCIALQLIL
jgi:hypothetical protein